MSSERRAILILLALAVAGQGIRYLATRPDSAPGDIKLLGSTPGRTPLAHGEAAQAAHRPLREGEKIDTDRATALELARLPRVGLALAQRIVADRDSNGAFGSLEGLDRVAGVGPGLLRAVGPHLAFSGEVREAGLASGQLPPPPLLPRLNVNTASVAELERLPLIGPSRARGIVAWRERHGSFKNINDLVLVPGVSQRMVDAIRHLVAF